MLIIVCLSGCHTELNYFKFDSNSYKNLILLMLNRKVQKGTWWELFSELVLFQLYNGNIPPVVMEKLHLPPINTMTGHAPSFLSATIMVNSLSSCLASSNGQQA